MGAYIGVAQLLPLHPRGCLYLASDQENIPSASDTIVQVDTVPGTYTDGIEDTGTYKITPGIAGLYIVTASLKWEPTVADNTYRFKILKDAATVIAEDRKPTPIVDHMTQQIARLFYFTSTNYLRLQVYHADGVGTVDITAGLNYTCLKVQRVG